jgi:signal peptidase II
MQHVMKDQLKARLKVMAPIIGLGILLDQLTKVWAEGHLQLGKTAYVFFFDTVRIQLAYNNGAFLGLGRSLDPHLRFLILTGLVGAFLLALFVYLLISKEMDRISLWALSLIFAGGFSNFIDRALNNGAVVDFLNMGVGGLRTGIFNVADVYIMIGAGLIIFGQWWVERRKK